MSKEKGKQSKLEKIRTFKDSCISQGEEFRYSILGFRCLVRRNCE
jgi:hypothetical protein